jgi:hypothetical protein
MHINLRTLLCGAWLTCSCASTPSSLPDLTDQTLDQVRARHASLLDERGVHRVLRSGVEHYFCVGAVEADADDSPLALRQESTMDAREVLLTHLVPDEQKRHERTLELGGMECLYAWTTPQHYWAGCFVPVAAASVSLRTVHAETAGPVPASVDTVAGPGTGAEQGSDAPAPIAKAATSSPAAHIAEPGAKRFRQPGSISGDALLAEARALAARGECRAAVAAYDRLLEEFAAFAVGAGIVREKFEVQKGCP